MQINEVIRKYRKQINMTQEEMANRLGVSAPAVNKWESGASMPDISLLAPIARLLHVSLEELLSFKSELTEVEVAGIVAEISGMLDKEPLDTVFQKMVETVREYPNSETLTYSLASLLSCRTLIQSNEERDKYFGWLQNCFENLLSSENQDMKMHAAESLYALFILKEQYDEATKCLDYFSPESPERKRKLATIYSHTGKYEEAYKIMEESLFSDYQSMSVTLHEIYGIAMKTENFEKARAILEKEAGLAELFEMGEYNKYAGKFHYAIAMKDAKQTLELLDKLMTHYDSLMDYVKSPLYEHMTFANSNPAVLEGMKTAQLNRYLEDDSFQFVRESPGWEDFKKKWYKAY